MSRLTDFESIIYSKVGWSKPPPILTSGFNRLKPPQSICKKVVNTGQYESGWSIENFKWPFLWWIEIFGQVFMFYLLKKEKNAVSSLPKALLTVKFQSQDLISDFSFL